MTVYLLNPNASADMTETMGAAARAAEPGLDFDAWTSQDAPPTIQGPADAERAMPALLEMVDRASAAGAEAIVIACFDDPGLETARFAAACPVIGAGEAALTLAGFAAAEVGVVTTVEAAVPVIRANVARMGLAKRVHVRAAGVPVIDLERAPERALDRFAAAAERLRAEADVGAVVAGCAGASELRVALEARLRLPVFDGVTAAARLCRALMSRTVDG